MDPAFEISGRTIKIMKPGQEAIFWPSVSPGQSHDGGPGGKALWSQRVKFKPTKNFSLLYDVITHDVLIK